MCKTENSVAIVENNACGKTNMRFATVFTCLSELSVLFKWKIDCLILGNVTAVTTVAPMTSTSTHQPEVAYFCLNDGVYDPSMQFCHCLSGFSGRSCERFDRKTKNWIF